MKPSTMELSRRSLRRFGTNLTNKRPLRVSKTQRIHKAPKQLSFASRVPAAPRSTFKYDLRAINGQRTGLEETEFCPSGSSWRPSLNRSLHRIVDRAFAAIGAFKLFIPSMETEEMDFEIPGRFELIECPQNERPLAFLEDSDSEHSEDDPFAFCIAAVAEEAEEVLLECPFFL